jgi:SAM-dependent methyltransferase
MHPMFAPHFRKPVGLFGLFAARFMEKNNGFVYPAIDEYGDFGDVKRILEIGYGPGVGLGYFLEKYDVRVDGVDFSPLMRKRATRRNRKHLRSGRLRVLLGDIGEDGLALDVYDRVVFANVLYFWDDLDAVFRKIKGLLAPGGSLVFYMSGKRRLESRALTRAPEFHRYDSSEVAASLRRSGFSSVAEHRILDDSGDFLVMRAEA